MVAPTRKQLVTDYWIRGLSIKKIAAKHDDINADRMAKLFKRYGVLIRATGGRGHQAGRSATVNQVRLELMLLPSVEEWLAMRPWRVLRDELGWLAREARCHT